MAGHAGFTVTPRRGELIVFDKLARPLVRRVLLTQRRQAENLAGADREADAFKRVAPSVQVLVIDGATHSGPRGAPGRPEFVAAVHDFLAAHRSTTSQ